MATLATLEWCKKRFKKDIKEYQRLSEKQGEDRAYWLQLRDEAKVALRLSTEMVNKYKKEA